MSSPFPDFSGRYPPRVFALVAAAHHHHELWQSQPTSWEKVKTSKNPRRTFQLVWTRIADATFQGSRFLGHMIISSRSGSILYHVPPWNQKLGKQCISQTFNNPLKTYGNRLDELKTWCPNHFPLLNYLIKPVNNGITSSQGLVILHHMMCTKKKKYVHWWGFCKKIKLSIRDFILEEKNTYIPTCSTDSLLTHMWARLGGNYMGVS